MSSRGSFLLKFASNLPSELSSNNSPNMSKNRNIFINGSKNIPSYRNASQKSNKWLMQQFSQDSVYIGQELVRIDLEERKSEEIPPML